MLAHQMAEYDGGAYAKEILEGDIHTTNMEAAGLTNRDQAKTFIYGFLYGAGSEDWSNPLAVTPVMVNNKR